MERICLVQLLKMWLCGNNIPLIQPITKLLHRFSWSFEPQNETKRIRCIWSSILRRNKVHTDKHSIGTWHHTVEINRYSIHVYKILQITIHWVPLIEYDTHIISTDESSDSSELKNILDLDVWDQKKQNEFCEQNVSFEFFLWNTRWKKCT